MNSCCNHQQKWFSIRFTNFRDYGDNFVKKCLNVRIGVILWRSINIRDHTGFLFDPCMLVYFLENIFWIGRQVSYDIYIYIHTHATKLSGGGVCVYWIQPVRPSVRPCPVRRRCPDDNLNSLHRILILFDICITWVKISDGIEYERRISLIWA